MLAAAALFAKAGCGEKKAGAPPAAASAAQTKGPADEATAQQALKAGVEAVAYSLPPVILTRVP
jgi:hypothetical protein